MGMSVFLGLRYAIWDNSQPTEKIAAAVSDLTEHGLAPREPVKK